MLKNSGTQEKGKITYQKYANDAVKFISCGKIKNLIFQKKYFSCYQQTSPLDVLMYAFGYSKTKVLAQFVDSKAFFLYP